MLGNASGSVFPSRVVFGFAEPFDVGRDFMRSQRFLN